VWGVAHIVKRIVTAPAVKIIATLILELARIALQTTTAVMIIPSAMCYKGTVSNASIPRIVHYVQEGVFVW
jgi:hypothetical protein